MGIESQINADFCLPKVTSFIYHIIQSIVFNLKVKDMACCSCKFNCSKGRLNQISYINDMACYACSF